MNLKWNSKMLNAFYEIKKIDEIFKNYSPKVVINLAAQAGVRYSLENPMSYIDSNIIGFLNISLLFIL